VRTGGVAVLLVGLGSCQASPPPAPTTPAPTVVLAAESETPATERPGPPECRRATRVGCFALTPEETASLDARIEAAHQAVVDSKYVDVGAIVEQARLQLRRESSSPDSDGDSDVERAMKNSMRAMVVDSTLPAVRLVTAMALARTLLNREDEHNAEAARIRLHLVAAQARAGLALSSVRPMRFVTSATHALLGYLALEASDLVRARTELETASRLMPDLATAWVGLGDVARARADFEAAASAYGRAAALNPNDPGLRDAIQAAAQREALSRVRLGDSAELETLAAIPLAPPPRPAVPCPPTARAHPANTVFCDGLDALGRTSTEVDTRDAAKRIVEGYQTLEPLCDAGDPACGDHVGPALAAAARSFVQIGLPAKGIQTYRLLLQQRGRLPHAEHLLPTATLEMADTYYQLAMYSQAASQYHLYAELVQEPKGPSAQRSLLLQAALGEAAGVDALARRHPEAMNRRSAALCHRFVVCAVRRLAGELGWP